MALSVDALRVFQDRIDGLPGAVLQALEANPPAEHVVIVSHGGALRSAFAHLLGMDDDLAWRLRVDNCSLTIFDNYPEGPIAAMINDTCHLTGDDRPNW